MSHKTNTPALTCIVSLFTSLAQAGTVAEMGGPPHPEALLATRDTPLTPSEFLNRIGTVFADFDEQDSGNVSFGVTAGSRRFFVKTPGAPETHTPLPHPRRVDLLLNAAKLAQDVVSPALPPLLNRIQSPHGPMLVFEWCHGDLLAAAAHLRALPDSPSSRFKSLSLDKICRALATVFDAHATLAEEGWIASDFYDGSLIYDFATNRVHLIDLDHYRQGPFINGMGRMFGSRRFMAPEELSLGATIDERTTVFNMGRCITTFLHDSCTSLRSLPAEAILEIEARACHSDPNRRFDSMAQFCRAWHAASESLLSERAG